MNKKILFVSCVFLMGCSPAKAPEATKENPTQTIQTVQWKEIPDQRIEFVKMFPGAAQKNIYMTWKLFENPETKAREYRVDNKPVSDEAAKAIEELRQSVENNLIPSDGIYTCRYVPNQPQYRLELNQKR